MNKPIILLTVYTLVIGVICYSVNILNNQLVYNKIYYFIIYYYFVSLLSNSFINFAVAKNKGNLTMFFLASMIGRLMLSVIFAVLFMMLDKTNLVVIGINFVVLHLLFLGLDLFIVIDRIKNLSKKDQNLNVGQST